MSERANFRGGRGGRGRGGRGGSGGREGGHQNKAQAEKQEKKPIIDLEKYIDKELRVKFSAGREGRNI